LLYTPTNSQVNRFIILSLYQLTKLTNIATNLTNNLISDLLYESPKIGQVCQDLYSLLEVNHILETLNRVKQYFSEVLLNNELVDSVSINRLIDIFNVRYFYPNSEIKLYLEDLLLSKGLQGYIREFSDEMTFRDFNKIKSKGGDEISGIVILI
jgi:hypothetical protein